MRFLSGNSARFFSVAQISSVDYVLYWVCFGDTKMCTYACEIKNLSLGWNVLALMQPAGSAGITY